MEWVTEDDRLIKTVIGSFKAKGDVNKAVDLLNDMLLFRAKWEVNGKNYNNNLIIELWNCIIIIYVPFIKKNVRSHLYGHHIAVMECLYIY